MTNPIVEFSKRRQLHNGERDGHSEIGRLVIFELSINIISAQADLWSHSTYVNRNSASATLGNLVMMALYH